MNIEFMTTAEPQRVTGWKGLSDAAHLERLKTALLTKNCRRRRTLAPDVRKSAVSAGSTAVVEELESIQVEMTEDARLFMGWRLYSGRWRGQIVCG